MTDLTIPDEAFGAAQLAAGAAVYEGDEFVGPINEAVRAAAPLIVAAELRRRSDEFERNARACLSFGCTDFAEGRSNGLAVARERLRNRANELDPDGAAENGTTR